MINVTAMFAAAAATVPVGALWYSPVLFAKPWMKLNGINPKKKAKCGYFLPFAATFGTSIVLAFLLSLLFALLKITVLVDAWKISTLLWFGLDFMPNLTRALFAKKPVELVLIDSGHSATNIIVATGVLMMWK
ncbi:DUF1761 domain-containing protein [Candidatus Peribacteria bacterium]|nr:DUF1761 domain-containing protein [Candidatus Peribacteria bacterium]